MEKRRGRGIILPMSMGYQADAYAMLMLAGAAGAADVNVVNADN